MGVMCYYKNTNYAKGDKTTPSYLLENDTMFLWQYVWNSKLHKRGYPLSGSYPYNLSFPIAIRITALVLVIMMLFTLFLEFTGLYKTLHTQEMRLILIILIVSFIRFVF